MVDNELFINRKACEIMKYIMGILSFILAIILLFDLVEFESVNVLLATIFLVLASILFNMKSED